MYLFAGRPKKTKTALTDLATYMSSPKSFYNVFAHKDQSKDRYHEQHNPHTDFLTICTILNAPRPTVADIATVLPPILARYKDLVYADDVWDKRAPDAKAAAHAKMGLDEESGGVVVVRPDGYVGCVVKLDEGRGTCEALDAYFSVVTGKKLGEEKSAL